MFFCAITGVKAQTENNPSQFTPNIIPPSPTAFALGTYGNTPVGLFTGSQNISIPIYTYKTANLEVPISAFYSSNGVKVDEISSNIGQSWNLSFGGVITRIVRDKPDEDRGSYPIPFKIADNANTSSKEALDFFQYIGENDVDTEADLFSFNFGKYSGKFIFDNDKGIIMMPAQPFKIECVPADGIFNFIVTTPDGVKYYFNDKEITSQRVIGGGHSIPTVSTSSWYLSKIVHPKGDEIQFSYTDASTVYTSSQSQNFRMPYPRTQYNVYGELLNPSGNLSSIYDNVLTLSGKAIKTIKSTNTAYGQVVFTYLSNSSADVTSGNSKISQITINDKLGAEIDKINFTYTTTTNNRVFLDKIQYKDPDQNYQFEYQTRNNFPQRLSFSQDHWGYYNGKTNTSLVPGNIVGYDLENTAYNGANREPDGSFAKIGLLTKITYPTKGYTTFDYESNDYYGDKIVYPTKTYKTLNVSTPEAAENAQASTDFTLTVQTKQNIEIFGGVSFYCSDLSLNTYKNRATYKVLNTTTGQYMPLYKYAVNGDLINDGISFTMSPNMEPSSRKHFFIALPNQTYKVILEAAWSCTLANISFNYYPTAITTVQTNIATGGTRVKQTNDYSINKTNPVIKRYFYAKKDDLTKSSGDRGSTPYYIDFTTTQTLRDDGGPYYLVDTFTYLNLSSSSIVSLFDTGNSNVFYKYVTVSNGDDVFSGGGEEHEFIVNRDQPGRILFGNTDIKSAPLTNFGWDNSLLKKVSYFNKNLKVIKETFNVYEERADLRREAVSYSSRKQYDMVLWGPVNHDCTQADVNTTFTIRYCKTEHKHAPGGSLVKLLGFADYDSSCIAAGNENVVITYHHPCYLAQPLPAQVTYINNLDNITILSYKNIAYWHYLKSTQETNYDLNGLNPVVTITNFNYANPEHQQLTSQSMTNSTTGSVGEVTETKYLYAPDTQLASLPYIADLKTANIIGTPLNTQIFKGSTKISEQTIVYDKSASTNNLLLSKSIYAAKFPNILTNITTPAVGQLEKKITFDQYDSKGNITQYTLENGTSVSFIWGYDKTLPIAKIENATLAQIASALGITTSVLDTYSEANMATLNGLRNNASLVNCMITTFTHLPLIGISTVTDPKADVMTYNYDAYNRLQTVKDRNGNILSENQYHYKN